MNRTAPSRGRLAGLLAALLLSVIVPSSGHGQSTPLPAGLRSSFSGGDPSEPAASRYAIRPGLENELRIDVQVWGQVTRPGQYSVPDQTDLIGLISYAGGPTEDAKLKSVQVLSRLAPTDRVRRVDLEAFMRTGDPTMIPRLSPGDVVLVPAGRSRSLTRMAGIVSVLALVANVAILASHK
jgi:polysaccharide biosynthesis/export protein